MNAAASSAAAANEPSTSAEIQPQSGPSMMPDRSAETVAVSRAAPIRSRLAGCRSPGGATRATATASSTASGPVTRNSTCQGSHCRMRPPPRVPRAPAAAVAPVQVAMARGLRSGGVTCRSNDKVAGMTRAAPRPVTTRPANSTVTSGAAADDRQSAAKTPRPVRSTPLRPAPVTERPGRDEQAAEHQDVGVDDPQQVGAARCQTISAGPG